MEYNFRDIEKKWQAWWKENKVYSVSNPSTSSGHPVKPKFYVLDMFPYPSGAGLHVGHPLGYIASDIYSRYKRLKGFNVLHPMGFDSFGLPAEQYALDTGQHPAETTKKNIATFKSQLDNIGFCYDWEREVQTSDPEYYRWTQWIFLQLFNSYFCHTEKKALPISLLIKKYETKGAMPKTGEPIPGKHFTAEQWNSFSEKEKADILMRRRLAYCGYGEVNWCEALGTVLANDEVVNGVSERGGYPVVKKTLRQWYLRITEYADRLLEGLEKVDFSDAMKEMQSNWIGKSSGAEIDFLVKSEKIKDKSLRVYTTRPDTIFGIDFMVIAPEHELVESITTSDQKTAVEEYITYVKSRSERERMAEKKITGVFTGAYAINPFDGREIPIWISEYVLAGYGTGAIMAVPCGDERDHKFAKHFNISITNIIGEYYNGEEANPTKEAVLQNSGFLNGLVMKGAMDVVIAALEEKGIGKRKVNYKMRDAAFSRQRYWGEPFPIVWKDEIAKEWTGKLPLVLPDVEKYSPGPDGQGPLANIPEWVAQELETNTMPGYAGSSWYFLRYMDPHNDQTFCDRNVSDYWNQVDLYIGGTEHAVGHLLYSRMWTKVLYDLDLIGYDEPYKRLVNQGMIQGLSQIAYVKKGDFEEGTSRSGRNTFRVPMFSNPAGTPQPKLQLYSADLINDSNRDYYKPFNIPIELVARNIHESSKNVLDISSGIQKYPQRLDAIYITFDAFFYEGEWKTWSEDEQGWVITEERTFYTANEVEKMSKSKYNVVNPNDIILSYGADTFRMYEMFLGPVEMSKPWDTKGIEGVHRFLKKFWRLFFKESNHPSFGGAGGGSETLIVTNDEPTSAELKVLHHAIRRIENDTERFSFNTGVSGFMIATNELTDLKCHKRKILEPLLILLAPYAPHIAEELWQQLGNEKTILDQTYPVFIANYVAESSKEYPVSINGKLRTTMNLALDATEEEVNELTLENEVVKKWLEGKPPKKIIFVKNKMINVVV
ncbi:MAG TPA: class I tRNA ligase family protein [Chitinophagaceae bacterium]|nr:class I tRNA ligase family protein [Chitinophagaceae bacterium]